MPVIPEFRRLRPENYKFKASQCYINSRRDGADDIKRGERGKEKINLFYILLLLFKTGFPKMHDSS